VVADLVQEVRLLKQELRSGSGRARAAGEKLHDFPLELPVTTLDAFQRLNEILESEDHRKAQVRRIFIFECFHPPTPTRPEGL